MSLQQLLELCGQHQKTSCLAETKLQQVWGWVPSAVLATAIVFLLTNFVLWPLKGLPIWCGCTYLWCLLLLGSGRWREEDMKQRRVNNSRYVWARLATDKSSSSSCNASFTSIYMIKNYSYMYVTWCWSASIISQSCRVVSFVKV
jgi:hypothetical protein